VESQFSVEAEGTGLGKATSAPTKKENLKSVPEGPLCPSNTNGQIPGPNLAHNKFILGLEEDVGISPKWIPVTSEPLSGLGSTKKVGTMTFPSECRLTLNWGSSLPMIFSQPKKFGSPMVEFKFP
jgi:hypothetical protein